MRDQRWLADHPGHKEVPPNVKTSLQNLKSVLRHKRRQKAALRKQAAPAAAKAASVQQRPAAPSSLTRTSPNTSPG